MISVTRTHPYCSVQEEFDCADGFFGKWLTKIETIELHIKFRYIVVGRCKTYLKTGNN